MSLSDNGGLASSVFHNICCYCYCLECMDTGVQAAYEENMWGRKVNCRRWFFPSSQVLDSQLGSSDLTANTPPHKVITFSLPQPLPGPPHLPTHPTSCSFSLSFLSARIKNVHYHCPAYPMSLIDGLCFKSFGKCLCFLIYKPHILKFSLGMEM